MYLFITGLDATASIELLNHLNHLAYSNRTVVLTIHQPRFVMLLIMEYLRKHTVSLLRL